MNNDGFTISPKFYNFLKWVALVLLPALTALYVGVGSLWNFPAVTQVVGTMTVLDTVLGIILNKSSKNFAKEQVVGDLIVQQDSDGLAAGIRMVAHRDPLILDEQKKAVFIVKREQQL